MQRDFSGDRAFRSSLKNNIAPNRQKTAVVIITAVFTFGDHWGVGVKKRGDAPVVMRVETKIFHERHLLHRNQRGKP